MNIEKVFNWECDDDIKRKNDILYQEYLNGNISKYDFEKSVYDNIWSKNLYCHPIIREDMWKKEMLRLIGENENE